MGALNYNPVSGNLGVQLPGVDGVGGAVTGIAPVAISLGGGAIATGQVTVGTTATLVVPARPGRQEVSITSTAATAFYYGAGGVTTANGDYVPATQGARVNIRSSGAIYAVVATGTLVVSYAEIF